MGKMMPPISCTGDVSGPALVPDLVGSHAVCAIPQHTDKTHAEALPLIAELVTIGACKSPTTQPPEKREANARSAGPPQATVTPRLSW
jgi:hypothetical protein